MLKGNLIDFEIVFVYLFILGFLIGIRGKLRNPIVGNMQLDFKSYSNRF